MTDKTRGGQFLVKETKCEAIFTPEDFNEEQLMMRDSVKEFVDKEIWPLKIRYIGKETITCDIGTFRCVKFRPIVQKGRIFKREDDLNVWLTDDKNHVPLRAEAKLMVGSIKLDIVAAKNLANPTSEIK